MELLGAQNQSSPIAIAAYVSSHWRRTRRARRGEIRHAQSQFPSEPILGNKRIQTLEYARNPFSVMSTFQAPGSKLEELKARKFTLVDRPQRVATSLAALQQPGAIQPSAEDWQWLDENSAIEDEFV